MTTKHQKNIEIMYAQKTGELLDELWKVEPSPDEVNWPDLIVTTKLGKFGLEVREIYLDESDNGSTKKAIENHNLGTIKKLTDDYYETTRFSIKADFWGDIGHYDQLLNAIIKHVEQLSEFEQKRLEPYSGCVIYIRRLPDQIGAYKRWNYVSDKIGWVRKIDQKVIEMAIVEKAKNLPKYEKKISDVRLLLVSDRIFNSGKARIANDIICDSCGFKKVYHLSYPEEVWQVSR